MRPIVYAFPGLGTDRRMFGLQLRLNCDLRIPDWIPPRKDEPMSAYAKRLAAKLDTSRPFSLMGVSLGGMMCMEVAKHVNAEKVILISSCKTRSELPPHLKVAGNLFGAKFIPTPIMRKAIQTWTGLLGDLPNSQKQVFDNMVRNVNGRFLMWAATAVTRWDNETVHDNVIHIHGDNDRVLPYRHVKADFTIRGGSHYMCASRSAEVNHLIERCLREPKRRLQAVS